MEMPVFRSFYLAGFECATGYNMHGEWIDQIAATEHDLHADADYRRLADVGIRAVREAIRWPLVDRAGRYDFSSVEPFVDAALEHGFDVIWDLFHYGYPDELDPFSAEFATRFADYCRAAARFVVGRMPGQCYFTPMNEPSFFAWAGGEVGRFAPHARGRAAELKVSLARAALRGIDAIREVCPEARIVNVDPVCRVVVDDDDPARLEHARRFNEQYVFEFWDIVSGRLMPELGGSPSHLDIVGINYYWTNQWALGREGVPLADDDPRRVPLAELVRATWRRYGCEIVITETSALGEARAPWIHELSLMAEELLGEGVPLGGICLYPILGMPEWHSRDQWTRMGLWDLEREQDVLERKACGPMMAALRTVHEARGTTLDQRARRLRLPRTGQAPFETHGRLVWQKIHPPTYALRVFHADRTHGGDWVLATTLRLEERTVEDVCTAGELASLVQLAGTRPPVQTLQRHGIDASAWSEEDLAAWRSDLRDLGAIVDQLERPRRRPAV